MRKKTAGQEPRGFIAGRKPIPESDGEPYPLECPYTRPARPELSPPDLRTRARECSDELPTYAEIRHRIDRS